MTWQDAWREGRTGWDAGRSPPALVHLVQEGSLPAGLAIVPGCGAGYDVLTLASPTRPTVGIDLAEVAAERFEALRGAAPAEAADHARVVVGDFFAWDPGAPVKLIWDYTFFCALDPSMRPAWGERIDALLGVDGELVTLLFPVTDDRPKDVGPPFAVSVELARAHLGPRFEAVSVTEAAESHPGRGGLEVLARWRRRR